jgi:hypothetical protein
MSSQGQSLPSVSEEGWQPNLKDYQQALGLTQKGIPLTTTRKERSATKVKEARGVADTKIEVSQGNMFLKQLELLTTKVKASREKLMTEQDYFSLQLKRVNPLLVNIPFKALHLLTLKEQRQVRVPFIPEP